MSNLKPSLACPVAIAIVASFLAGPSAPGLVAFQEEQTQQSPPEGAQPATPDQTQADEADQPQASADTSLPRLSEMEVPTAEDLLHGPRLDWVVLRNEAENVIITAPVTPRPDTLNQMKAALDQKLKERRNLTGEALERYRQELDRMAHLQLDLPTQMDETAYEIHMDRVGRIIHHEDLMLMRIDRLIAAENFELAYELLNVLRRNTPDWPGAAERHAGFLLAEADRRLRRGQLESALATLEEVHQRSATFKGVSEAAGEVIDRLVQLAVEQQDWRRARHFINRLRRMYQQHPVAASWSGDLQARAEQHLSRADQARSGGDYAEATTNAEQAARIWPAARNLRSRHRVHVERFQRLHVGVLDLPTSGFGDPILATAADRRSVELQTLHFFHVDNASDGSAHYGSRFCDRWEPLNLGREAVFDLRSSRQPWEMQPVITAPAIAERLARRLDPGDELYDERLAGYTRSVRVDSPYSFRVIFDRVPVRTEALLTFPVEPRMAADDLLAFDSPESPVSVEAVEQKGGFELIESDEQSVKYCRNIPEPEGMRQYRLAEIHEHRYASHEEAFRALLQGQVSLISSLPPRYIDRLRNDEEQMKNLFVQKMAVPRTHVIQLNPRSDSLKNSEFRRSLVYGIDRQTLLKEIILDGAPADLARLVSGPFPSTSYANNVLATPRTYDTVSAISLALAARKQLGGELPPLRMVVEEDPVVRAAAQRIIAGWKLFGIEVAIISPPARLAESDQWDLLYRTVQMLEPAVELWPFLTLKDRAQVADLDPFPDWLRQEIINLDLIGEWREAVQETRQIHLHLWSEVMLIPLWEVDEYLVYRKNIRGVPVNPVTIYDEVDRWVVEAWYPADEP